MSRELGDAARGIRSLWWARARALGRPRIGVLMWWTRKRSKASKAAEAEAAAEAAAEAQAKVEAEMPLSKHRNAFILMGIGGAALATFGIAAIAGIFGPVFFALVLTICVHPLRVWLEKSGVPRGLATGSVITAVTLLLLGFGYLVLVAFAQFAELLPQFKDQIVAFGQAWRRGCRRSASTPTRSTTSPRASTRRRCSGSSAASSAASRAGSRSSSSSSPCCCSWPWTPASCRRCCGSCTRCGPSSRSRS